MALTVRELWNTVLDHLPFREESRLLEAREAVNEHFPEEEPEPEQSNVTSAGVKDSTGGEWNPNSGLPNPNA